jgi:hypothetical protein
MFHWNTFWMRTASDEGAHGLLIRNEIRSDCIRGTLFVGSERFQILERPWEANTRNKSCIPSGSYKASFLSRSASGKYRNVFHLAPVTGRSGILIHNGNTVDHSRGCLIIGKRRGWLAGKPAVLNSRTALGELAAFVNHSTFQLTIFGDQRV